MINKNYINGSWRDSNNGSTFEVENPFTEEVISKVPDSSAHDVDAAVQAAKQAWRDWKMLGSLDMRDLLREIAVKSRDNDKEIASIITAESGKPLIECLDEIEWIASIFEYYSEIGFSQIILDSIYSIREFYKKCGYRTDSELILKSCKTWTKFTVE